MEKLFDGMKSRTILKEVLSYLIKRQRKRIKDWFVTFKSNWFQKPVGSLIIAYHSIVDKLYNKMYERGWLKRPRESLEDEFDKKSKVCFEKEFMAKMKAIFEDRQQGNANLFAVQDGQPIFSAVGAYIYRDLINRLEFDIHQYPHSRSFVGGSSVGSAWAAGLKSKFNNEFSKLFLNYMDIDVDWTVSPSSNAYYSRGLINMSEWFIAYFHAGQETKFFIHRFLTSYMRLVYLEQRKLDVKTEYVNKLKKKWEQDLVHEFTIGVTLIGISQYALVYKSLPAHINKRVPSYRARNTYETQGTYRRPTQLFAERKH